jgi:transposase-like protein
MSRIKKVKCSHRYPDDYKRKIALEYLSGRFSYAVAAEEYGLGNKDVVKEFVRWYRKNHELSAEDNNTNMAKSKPVSITSTAADLQKQIDELQAALRMSHLKVEALETMIDIAEEQLQIDIRKKSGSQRLKK